MELEGRPGRSSKVGSLGRFLFCRLLTVSATVPSTVQSVPWYVHVLWTRPPPVQGLLFYPRRLGWAELMLRSDASKGVGGIRRRFFSLSLDGLVHGTCRKPPGQKSERLSVGFS